MKQLSNFFQVNGRDLAKGLVMAFLGSVLTALVAILENHRLPNLDELKAILIMGLATGFTYLVKNFLTNSDDKFLKREP